MPAQLPQRIGLNLLYLVPGAVGGTEIYARELIHELAAKLPGHEFVAYVVKEAAEPLAREGWPENVSIRVVKIPGAVKPLRALVEVAMLPAIAGRDKVGLLHSLGTSSPAWGRHARAVTVHDLIFHHHPETFPKPAQKGLELIVPAGARHAHRVLADSQATKDDLIVSYGIVGEKIDVVYLGLGHSAGGPVTPEVELRERYELGDRQVILCVASALAHKNVPRLLEAYVERFGDAADGPALVVAGHAGLEQGNLERLAADLGVSDSVRFTGWVKKADLEGLYALATCFAYPTLREGFGLPVLEAMARGVPVACSNTSSVPEVAGDAAELFDPLDTTAIGDAVARVLDDPEFRAQLIERGHARAAEFTWARSADATIASYRAAVEARNRS